MPAEPVVASARLTRREGLMGLALLGPLGLLAACSSDATPAPATASGSPSATTTDIGAQELSLMAQYAAVISAFPALADALTPLAEQHRQHADALGVPDDAEPGPTPTSTPATAADALAMLATAERQAMRACIDACTAATEPGRARILAFIAASEGSHVPALRQVRP